MTNINDVLFLDKQYVVSKVSGRIELKAKLEKLGFSIGREIIVKKYISDDQILLSFVDNNKNVRLKTKYLQYLGLLDSSSTNLDSQIQSLNKTIKVNVFQTGISSVFVPFGDEKSISFLNYNFEINNLPHVPTIFGEDYQNKKLRNIVLEETPDVFLGLLDCENISKDLFLASQFMDMGVKMILVLRNYNPITDEKIDFEYLSRLIGAPIISYSDLDELNLENEKENLLASIIENYENPADFVRAVYPKYGRELEKYISKSVDIVKKKTKGNYSDSPRFIALEMIERDYSVLKIHYPEVLHENINSYFPRKVRKLEKLYAEHIFTIMKYARQDFVKGIISQVSEENQDYHVSRLKDKIFMNKALRLPLFFLYMLAALFVSFFVGSKIGIFLDQINILENLSFEFDHELLNSLVFDAILPMLWIIIKFIPYVFVMYLFICVLECTGYLNRLAFFINKDMNAKAPKGRFFIPFILNYARGFNDIADSFLTKSRCDKLLILCILPFVLSAIQLPFYMLILFVLNIEFSFLIIAAYFILSVFFVYLFTLIFGQTIRKQSYSPQILRLEPYRRISFKFILSYFLGLSKKFFRKILLPLIFASIIIWSLSCPWKQDANIQESLAYKIGNSIELITKPLEFDWKMNLGIIIGLVGKEASVSALNVVSEGYNMLGHPSVSIFVSIAFVLFLMIYLPYFPSLFRIWKKQNAIWILYTFIYSVSIAWLLAFSCVQLGRYIV